MRYFGLVSITLLALALTVSLLPAAGWFCGRHSAPSSRFCEPCFHVRGCDLDGDSAQRCQHAQPTHWRYLVLHR